MPNTADDSNPPDREESPPDQSDGREKPNDIEPTEAAAGAEQLDRVSDDQSAETIAADDGSESEDTDPSLEGILGAESSDESLPRPSLEPETPQLENVVFVLVGVVFSILVIWRLVAVAT